MNDLYLGTKDKKGNNILGTMRLIIATTSW